MITDGGTALPGYLKFLAVARVSSKDIVASLVVDSRDNPEQYQNTVMEVLGAPGFAGKVTAGARYRLAGDVNAFNFTIDQEQRVYVLISALEYPERLAFQLINEMIPKFQQEFGAAALTSPAKGLDGKARKMFQTLVEQYNDPARMDKLARVQKQVDDTTSRMGASLNQMLANIDKAQDIEESSNQLRSQADMFQRQSTTLRRQELWKKYQTTAMIVCFVLVVILLLIVAFAGPRSAPAPSPTTPPTGTSPPSSG